MYFSKQSQLASNSSCEEFFHNSVFFINSSIYGNQFLYVLSNETYVLYGVL